MPSIDIALLDRNTDSDGVRVYRSTSPMNPEALPTPYTVLPRGVSTYTDPDVIAGQVYYYRFAVYRGDQVLVSKEYVMRAWTYAGPGSNVLVAGDEMAGFYGEVPVEDFFRGDDLAESIGLSAGAVQYSTEPWLKFALDGRTLLVAKRPFRNTISWDQIHAVGAVYGEQTVTHKGVQYRVRLLKGASSDPSGSDSNGYDTPSTHGSEWNRLMYHIAQGNRNDVFTSSPAHGDWAQYSDADLVFASGDGRYTWCQEAWGGDTNRRVNRGGNGVSYFFNYTSSFSAAAYGWRPVLELVQH